jgi:hypothetical protein
LGARKELHRETKRSLFGRRYVLPALVARRLEEVFAESVKDVVIIEYSFYARLHLGMRATTRPNRILLAGSGTEFVSNAELVLHEYFHVLRQWRTGRLTHWRYLVESARRGYWNNHFEREARGFAADALSSYRAVV